MKTELLLLSQSLDCCLFSDNFVAHQRFLYYNNMILIYYITIETRLHAPITPSERYLERNQKVPGWPHDPGRPGTFWFLSWCLSEGVTGAWRRVCGTRVTLFPRVTLAPTTQAALEHSGFSPGVSRRSQRSFVTWFEYSEPCRSENRTNQKVFFWNFVRVQEKFNWRS
jgi:hypothetical protein